MQHETYNTRVSKDRQKPKMGRPPKPVEDKQGERVSVNMTRQERRELEQEANEAGMSLAAYLLDCWKRRRR